MQAKLSPNETADRLQRAPSNQLPRIPSFSCRNYPVVVYLVKMTVNDGVCGAEKDGKHSASESFCSTHAEVTRPEKLTPNWFLMILTMEYSSGLARKTSTLAPQLPATWTRPRNLSDVSHLKNELHEALQPTNRCRAAAPDIRCVS